MTMRILPALLLAASSLAAVPASAATIVDTGPVPANPAFFVYGGSEAGSTGVAGLFSLAALTKITSIEFYGAATGSVTGNIRANGALPGAVLYSGIVTPGAAGIQWVGLANLDWALAAGSYWLSFESADQTSAFSEAVNFPNPLTSEAFQFAGVYGPASQGNGRAFAFRVSGDALEASGAVPEPATWAMMIVGFGMAAGVMRRRKVNFAFA